MYRVPLTDRSGTIAAANVSQQVAAANTNRSFFMFQNLSAGDLYLNFGGNATVGTGSIKIVPGDILILSGPSIPVDSVHAIGGTIGQAYTAKEG